MPLEVLLQLRVGRLDGGGEVLGYELHLLAQAAPYHRVVPVEAHCDGLTIVDLLRHVVVRESLQFLRGRRPHPGLREVLRKRLDARLSDHDLAGRLGPAAAQEVEKQEQRRADQQEVQQRLAQPGRAGTWVCHECLRTCTIRARPQGYTNGDPVWTTAATPVSLPLSP